MEKISELLNYVDEILNQEKVKINNLEFEPAEIIKKLDPIAYRQIVLDIADNERIEIDELTEDKDF